GLTPSRRNARPRRETKEGRRLGGPFSFSGEWGDGGAFRAAQAGLDQRRDPEAARARQEGHGAEGAVARPHPKRGIDQESCGGGRPEDRQAEVRAWSRSDASGFTATSGERRATAVS